jgi:AraC-like DNA-binding protein
MVEDVAMSYGLNIDELHQRVLGGEIQNVTVSDLERATEWLISGSKKPWLPLELGTMADFSQLGVFGRLVASCVTYKDALELSRTYNELLHPLHDTDFAVKDGKVEYLYRTDRSSVQKPLYAEIALGAIPFWSERLTGKPLILDRVCFRHAEPPYAEKYRNHFRCDVLFSQTTNSLLMDASILDEPVLSASPHYHTSVLEEANRQLKHMATWSSKVEDIIRLRLPLDVSIQEAAGSLHCSERTLQRKLSEEETTFKLLKQSVRHREAVHLLKNTSMSIEQIAFHMGYEQRSSFAAAFKAQSGLSPGRWRTVHK